MRSLPKLVSAWTALVLAGAATTPHASAQASAAAAALRSAPISNVRYEVTFNATTARERSIHVAMTFDAASSAPVLLSLPVWTPGAYEVSNFVHWLSGFDATARGAHLRWDKTDPDTWRVRPT